MRKLTAAILILVYVTVTSGVALGLHFCGSTLASVSFYDNPQKCSCPAKMKVKPKSCCSEETVHIKLKTEHKTVVNTKAPASWFTALAQPVLAWKTSLPVSTYHITGGDPSPPPDSRPLYLRISVLLI